MGNCNSVCLRSRADHFCTVHTPYHSISTMKSMYTSRHSHRSIVHCCSWASLCRCTHSSMFPLGKCTVCMFNSIPDCPVRSRMYARTAVHSTYTHSRTHISFLICSTSGHWCTPCTLCRYNLGQLGKCMMYPSITGRPNTESSYISGHSKHTRFGMHIDIGHWWLAAPGLLYRPE